MTSRQIPSEEWAEPAAPDIVSERLQQLSSDDVEKILERAISLQMRSSDPDRDSIDPEALGRIADELGIDRRHLRAAMIEELVRIDEEDPGWLSRNLMPNKIAESRTVAASPDRVRAVLDHWLASQEGLRKQSSSAEGATWTRDGSPLVAIKTAFNMTQGDGSLRSVNSLRDTIKPLTIGNQIVSVEADTSNLRQLAVGLLVGSGLLGAAAMGISAGIDPSGFGVENVAAGLGVAAVAGGGVWLGFRMWGQKLRRGVARVADAVAHPHLVQVAESVPQRLSRFVDQIRTIGEEFRR